MTFLPSAFPSIPVLAARCIVFGGISTSLICFAMFVKRVRVLAYDTPLWKAIAYVAERTGDSKEADYFRKTRTQIEEKALSGELLIWGHKQLDSDPDWVQTRKFSDRCMPIPAEYWAISKLAPYAAVEPISVNVPSTQCGDRGTWPKERNAYADLRVNWRQIKKLWPSQGGC